MTERIDHATEAMNFLGATVIDTHGDDDRKVAIAQVHATLALVEQQRIADLIGVMANALVGVGAGEHSTAEYVRLHQRINPQILAALGLTAGQEGENDEAMRKV